MVALVGTVSVTFSGVTFLGALFGSFLDELEPSAFLSLGFLSALSSAMASAVLSSPSESERVQDSDSLPWSAILPLFGSGLLAAVAAVAAAPEAAMVVLETSSSSKRPGRAPEKDEEAETFASFSLELEVGGAALLRVGVLVNGVPEEGDGLVLLQWNKFA